MDTNGDTKESHRRIQTSQKTHQTKNGATTTILVEGFKLESPHLYTKSPQNSAGDWQHPSSPKTTKTLTSKTDFTTENSPQPSPEPQHEDLYELLHDAADNYFPQQPNNLESDPKSEIQHTTKHHVTIKTSCNDEKQPLLNEDLTE